MDQESVRARLAALEQEHRDMDDAIDALTRTGPANLMQVSRLKKRKLSLKDQIGRLQGMLIPDIIA
ncbi:YdcH family protein [Yunchengibacter salinarum]|uniref:YdcH family protein n=1 Tax=Yunchengibacter salinarum TaxID=3133399 RepID=UPI0035B5E42D